MPPGWYVPYPRETILPRHLKSSTGYPLGRGFNLNFVFLFSNAWTIQHLFTYPIYCRRMFLKGLFALLLTKLAWKSQEQERTSVIKHSVLLDQKLGTISPVTLEKFIIYPSFVITLRLTFSKANHLFHALWTRWNSAIQILIVMLCYVIKNNIKQTNYLKISQKLY